MLTGFARPPPYVLSISLHSFVLRRRLYLTLDCPVFLSFKPCSGTDTEFSSRKMCYMCFDDLDKYVDIIYIDIYERRRLVLHLLVVYLHLVCCTSTLCALANGFFLPITERIIHLWLPASALEILGTLLVTPRLIASLLMSVVSLLYSVSGCCYPYNDGWITPFFS